MMQSYDFKPETQPTIRHTPPSLGPKLYQALQVFMHFML